MSHYDVYAVGNALVDSEYEVSDDLLQTLGVEKRHMTLIDAPRRSDLLAGLQGLHARRTGGGSAGNTVVALAQLGARAFYSCRVADDELGAFYRADLDANGVHNNLSGSAAVAGQTGVCLVLVTPDAERSMSTFLGATADLDAGALKPEAVAAARVYYMEGYLAASPTGLDAALQGRAMARAAGVALAATLSDTSMIHFCRPGLQAMIGDGLDYLFCNEEEAQVWCGTTDLDALVAQLGALARVVCLTRGAKGCLVIEASGVTQVPAVSVQALDTNGAGDMFAGAFLYAVTQGFAHSAAAALANQAASRVVAQYGNRLTTDVLQSLRAQFLASEPLRAV